MGKFAKVFDIGDEQLLVKLTTDRKGMPCVMCSTLIKGIEISVGPTFTPRSKTKQGQAQKAAVKYYDSIGKGKAMTIFEALHDQYRKTLEMEEALGQQ